MDQGNSNFLCDNDPLTSEARKIGACSPTLPQDISELQHELNEVLQSCMLSNFAKYTRLLERRLRELLGVKHALTVANGTTGLQILLSTLPKSSEVLVPSFTFSATVHSIVHAQLVPRFVDVEKNTYNLCPQDVEAKITENTSAILAVNIFGNPCRIEELETLAKERHLKLFFDSAAAFGSKYRGRYLGSFGDAEVFSMSGTKVVTAGEGGVVTTNDDDLAEEISCKRNYGYDKRVNDCVYVGFNGKLNEVSAVIALWSLRDLQRNITRRKEIAEIYYNNLTNVPGIQFQEILDGCETNFCAFPIEIDYREFGMDVTAVLNNLKREGIETIRYFYPPIHKTRAYKEYNEISLERTEKLSQQILCLPMHPNLGNEQVNAVCRAIERAYAHSDKIMQRHVELSRKQRAAKEKRLAFQ